MDPINLNYSTKNIPIHTNEEYMKTIINKAEIFLRNIRWRAFFYLNPHIKGNEKNTYGFNSTRAPPIIPELKEFEEGMLKLIQSIQFKKHFDEFQNQLTKDIREIRKSDMIYVAADKTTNFYKVDPKKYEELMQSSLQKDYHKSHKREIEEQTKEDKRIAENLGISERIDRMAKKEAFITLKDHKENFRNKPQCRLINPSKTEIGKISKEILERINNEIREQTTLNQWRNTNDAIEWFMNIENKKECNTIVFDICEFYPSISEELLDKALDFAKTYCNITEDEIHIIKHTKKSTIFHKGETWKKNNKDFDVPMGSFDSAEACELVGLYLLSEMENIDANIGLYRDDGLAVTNKSARETENIKKKICHIFKNNKLKITIKANVHIVDFLDTTLNFRKETFEPFMKPNNTPLYVNTMSNHPPSIIKNIPEGINKRLNNISCNEQVFKKATPIYTKALRESGHDHPMEFKATRNEREKQKKKTRSRRITWFNPPFSKNVRTNVGKKFLKLIGDTFPIDHKLHCIINKNTVKISYCCLPNLHQIIAAHNKKIINQSTNKSGDKDRECNCRKKEQCPMINKCLTREVVYQATVTHPNQRKESQTYIGSTETTFKTRFNEHINSFKNNLKRRATTLSEYIWKCKEENTPYNITWNIIKKANSYTPQSTRCNLCTTEKMFITTQPHKASLNRKCLISTCRHRQKHTLQKQEG